MRLSIITVTHNSRDALSRLLGGLDPDLKKRILILDNASIDGTVEIAMEHNVVVVQHAYNLGFARAANAGARMVSDPVLCFLNPDCRPGRELFTEGKKAVLSDRQCCAVPLILEAEGEMVPGCQPGYTSLKLLCDTLMTNYGRNRLWRWLRNRDDYDDLAWSWPHGACFFVARDFFFELGGFNERYFLYMEDVDFGRRLYNAGGRVTLLRCTVDHGGGMGSSINYWRRLFLLNMGRIRYAASVYGMGLALTLAVIALPALIFRGGLGFR